jgi:outer membrane protein assembly factor BamB
VSMLKSLLGVVVLVMLAQEVRAEDWPGWRGPRLDGSSIEKNLPITWNNKENIAWRADIPGVGHSSPIVVGDRVFVTSCLLEEGERVLYCLDRREGKKLWEKIVVRTPLEKKHKLNSFASATPACDGEHVYVAFLQLRPRTDKDQDFPRKPRDVGYLPKDVVSEMLISCYTVNGDLVWQKVPGQFCSRHGFCSTPILHKDKVIINGDQDAEAYIVALDKKTGEERWRIDRPNRTRSYCAPLILEAAGKTQMVLSGSECVTSYDPDSGKLIWIIKGPTEQYVASLVYGEGLFFLTAGFPTYHNMAIRPDGVGDVTTTHVVWHESKTAAKKASYVPSPIAVDKYFYMISDLGSLSCFEAKTGKRMWMEELGRHHSASPVLADGYVYLTDDDGITYVLKAGSAFEVVARNPLHDECYSSPAISQGQIFLRTLKHVYCIGKK